MKKKETIIGADPFSNMEEDIRKAAAKARLGKGLKDKREEQNLSQEEFSKKYQIDLAIIQEIELTDTLQESPSVNLVLLLAKSYHVRFTHLAEKLVTEE